jgi:16S rRNA (cytosine967-C5)-methyltransferase
MIGKLRSEGVDLDALFTGEGHAPAQLGDGERAAGRDPVSEGERLDLPDWLVPLFRRSLGDGIEEAAGMLRTRAPVTLRINSRMNSVGQAIEVLKEDGIDTHPVPEVETALTVRGGARRINGSRAYLEGCVELQDASSQAAMAMIPVPEGGRVLDFCAGGGGKVLALAGRAEAEWYAHDADPARMRDLPARAARAGVDVACLSPGAAARAAPYDMVLCDVPCSGSGTWRRAPDAKWRLTPERLEELVRTQAAILETASALVRPGGVLAYTTCSVLNEENRDQAELFLASHPGWRVLDERQWPVSEASDGFYLAVFGCPDASEIQP